MKRILISAMTLLTAAVAMAQPAPVAVEPGSKGPLPAAANIDKTVPAGQFVGLQLNRVTMSSTIFNGSVSFETWLNFPEPQSLGGEYFTLETDSGQGWKTYGDDEEVHFTYNNATPTIYGSTVRYRLRMHGGDKDGFVSNTVTASRPSSGCLTHVGGWSTSGDDMYLLVGREQMKGFYFNVSAYDRSTSESTDYDQNSEYMRYQWYRRNPYNYDMTPIDGATQLRYTPTMDDVGYELALVISGDGQHCDFTFCYYMANTFDSIVRVPVACSMSYYGPEGFIINTDYVLDDPARQFVWSEYDGKPETLPATIVTKKPGQYAVLCPDNVYESWYEMDIADDSYKLIIQYLVDWGEEPELWMREVQHMPRRYWAPLTVNTTLDGKPAAATVEALGPDIDGNMVVKATATTDETGTVTIESDQGLSTIGDGYYVRARANGSAANVYYPGAQAMTAAKLVKPGYDEESNPAAITIELQGGTETKQGDVNGDGTIDVADIAAIIDVMAGSGQELKDKADVNGDSSVDVADIATVIDIMAGE